MKYLVSFILGAFSGFLLMMMGSAFFYGYNRPMNRLVAPTLFLPLFFVVAWAVSTLLLVRRAEDAVRVIKRACLLGASEWLLFPLVWGVFGSPAPFQARGFGVVGPGIMALVCLAVYAVARFMSPKTAPDLVIQLNQPILKQCSRCGQLAESLARFCNSCGTPFVAGGLGKTNTSRE